MKGGGGTFLSMSGEKSGCGGGGTKVWSMKSDCGLQGMIKIGVA